MNADISLDRHNSSLLFFRHFLEYLKNINQNFSLKLLLTVCFHLLIFCDIVFHFKSFIVPVFI